MARRSKEHLNWQGDRLTDRGRSPSTDAATRTLQHRFGVRQPTRGWLKSVVFGAVVTAAILVFAVWVNIALGRQVHWEVVGIFAALGLAVLTVGWRTRII